MARNSVIQATIPHQQNNSRENETEEKNEVARNGSTEIDVKLDTYFSDERILIPNQDGLSLRKLWAFTGPGCIMSIAFIDPGNIEADLQSGAIAKYKLLWIVLIVTILGLLVQRLTARCVGVVTGCNLAELCYKNYKKVPRIIVWIMTEISIIGADMQEVIGTSIALYILSNKTIPIWAGTLITIVDTFTILMVDRYGLRKLELIFAVLIGVMAVAFGYEYGTSAPSQIEVLEGIFVPGCEGCGSKELFQAVAIIGAVITPYNLHLHSALVKSRDVNRKNKNEVSEANFYFFTEATMAVIVTFFINVFIISVFGHGLFGRTNNDIVNMCQKQTSFIYEEAKLAFGMNDDNVNATLYTAGIYLGCAFGAVAMYIWAIGLLAAGQSSTMTGTYAGQFVMEGCLNLRWVRWKRVLITRTVAIVPTFYVAFYTQIHQLSRMSDFLNVLMALQLPFTAIPTIAFSSSPAIMGKFVSGVFNKIMAICFCFLVIALNIFVVSVQAYGASLSWEWITLIAIVGTFYILLNLYLIVHMIACMGNQYVNNSALIQKYVLPWPNAYGIPYCEN